LPAQRAVGPNFRGGEYGLAQAFIDWQCLELFLGQFDQPLAQLLQLQRSAARPAAAVAAALFFSQICWALVGSPASDRSWRNGAKV
jgi:hypothetical protein